MYLTAAFEEKVAIEAVTHAPVRYNHESVESGHTGFDVITVQRGFYLKSLYQAKFVLQPLDLSDLSKL